MNKWLQKKSVFNGLRWVTINFRSFLIGTDMKDKQVLNLLKKKFVKPVGCYLTGGLMKMETRIKHIQL